jgi:hypothetical protein
MEKKMITIREDRLETLKKIWGYAKIGWQWIYKLRSVILAIPVILTAISLAMDNAARLPVFVGINLQANGEYAFLISRGLAVMAPLVVTGVCLVMMWLSRRTIYPWIISIFSLVLPILIWLTNVFPG